MCTSAQSRVVNVADSHSSLNPVPYGRENASLSGGTRPDSQCPRRQLPTGDSRTSAKLVRCCEMALRLDPSVRDGLPYHMNMLDDVRRRIDQFDVLHFHIDLLHAPLVRDIADRTLTTLHGRLDLPDLAPFYGAFRELPLASIAMVRHHLPRSSTRSSSSSQTRVATASLYKRSTIHPQYSAAAAPGFRCERTFSKWH